MPYNFAADSFTQRNFVAEFFQAKCDFTRKSVVLRFWDSLGGYVVRRCTSYVAPPPLGGNVRRSS